MELAKCPFKSKLLSSIMTYDRFESHTPKLSYLSTTGLEPRNLLVGKAWKKAVDGFLCFNREIRKREEKT